MIPGLNSMYIFHTRGNVQYGYRSIFYNNGIDIKSNVCNSISEPSDTMDRYQEAVICPRFLQPPSFTVNYSHLQIAYGK